jgi:hypothetical protein
MRTVRLIRLLSSCLAIALLPACATISEWFNRRPATPFPDFEVLPLPTANLEILGSVCTNGCNGTRVGDAALEFAEESSWQSLSTELKGGIAGDLTQYFGFQAKGARVKSFSDVKVVRLKDFDTVALAPGVRFVVAAIVIGSIEVASDTGGEVHVDVTQLVKDKVGNAKVTAELASKKASLGQGLVYAIQVRQANKPKPSSVTLALAGNYASKESFALEFRQMRPDDYEAKNLPPEKWNLCAHGTLTHKQVIEGGILYKRPIVICPKRHQEIAQPAAADVPANYAPGDLGQERQSIKVMQPRNGDAIEFVFISLPAPKFTFVKDAANALQLQEITGEVVVETLSYELVPASMNPPSAT